MYTNNTTIMKTIASRYHTAVITAEGKVVYWRKDPVIFQGRDDSIYQCDFPEDLENVVAIELGQRHSVALTAEGRVICSGDNSAGQCNIPADLEHVIQISCLEWFTAALTAECRVVCWGRQ